MVHTPFFFFLFFFPNKPFLVEKKDIFLEPKKKVLKGYCKKKNRVFFFFFPNKPFLLEEKKDMFLEAKEKRKKGLKDYNSF